MTPRGTCGATRSKACARSKRTVRAGCGAMPTSVPGLRTSIPNGVTARVLPALWSEARLWRVLSVAGSVFGIVHGIDNFAGASILAFSGVSYLLMWTSYFLFARRLRAAAWFAPIWVLSYIPAAVLTLVEIHRVAHGVEPGETLTQPDSLLDPVTIRLIRGLIFASTDSWCASGSWHPACDPDCRRPRLRRRRRRHPRRWSMSGWS